MKISIVGFMQNPWFPDGTPQEHIRMYRYNQEFHKKILVNSMSGQRLKQAFGDEMFERIWWDNVAPEAATEAKGKTDVDMQHVEAIIKIRDPQLILTFGKMATDAIKQSIGAIRRKVMECHHPNARYKTQSELDAFAVQVHQWILVQERNDEFTAEDNE